MAPTTFQGEFNAASYLVDRNLVAGAGERVAVRTPARTLSYAELSTEVRRAAAGLRQLGVRPEERVLLCLPDDVELFTAILASMYLGAIAVPVSTMLTGQELGKLVTDSRATVVLGAAEYEANVRAAVRDAPDVRHLVWQGGVRDPVAGLDCHSWEAVASADPAEVTAAFPSWPDSPALWLYTSGTTGTPKAAMHRHTDIRFVAENYAQRVLGVGPRDRFLSVAKLFFAYGIGNSMFFPLSVGGTALLEPARPNPQLIADRATADSATLLFGTPSFWGPLLASGVADGAFSTVRQGVSAGEALPARMFHGMRDRFGVEVLDGIGSTEMLHIFISNRPGEVRPSSSGVPVPGYEVEIRDSSGVPIDEQGVPGELYVRGDSAAIGYWCRAGVSREVFLGDWMRTGDTYLRNSDGTFSCLGRFNDMLKAGGIWVAPAEVEDRLLEHPSVAEVAVVGVADEDGLDRVTACVVPKQGHGVAEDELISWCRETLAAFKRPRAVVQLAELPKTATGKIRRNVLREMLAVTVDSTEPAAVTTVRS
ncbi:benzoate-CoA ligase [Tamaricihabitans halophyticus]|uniref:Benzoate-CoA ligase n=1 Tax=Tamaricihabitans halophyticus TaxID=1262583 RepID=A0A4R2R3N3_9PSEU|nr:benzoate-CoA ligase family protein [Tamaricihabitans halophyticus]TCP56474.1 benzoate-CoA ligase [Tamaricihabitans halophyticus]